MGALCSKRTDFPEVQQKKMVLKGAAPQEKKQIASQIKAKPTILDNSLIEQFYRNLNYDILSNKVLE